MRRPGKKETPTTVDATSAHTASSLFVFSDHRMDLKSVINGIGIEKSINAAEETWDSDGTDHWTTASQTIMSYRPLICMKPGSQLSRSMPVLI
jgi:hypothetical protein